MMGTGRRSRITRMKPDRSYGNGDSQRRKLLEEELTREIIGAFYEVYNALGFGLLESLYGRALEIALRRRGLRVDREFPIEVFFQGQQIGVHRLDMLVEQRVIVELKASHKLIYADRRQLMSYVTVANLDVGLLLHFGPRPAFQRVLGGRRPNVKRGNPNSSG